MIRHEFKEEESNLGKTLRPIADVIIDQLQKGIVVGNQIPEVGYPIFKVRAIKYTGS